METTNLIKRVNCEQQSSKLVLQVIQRIFVFVKVFFVAKNQCQLDNYFYNILNDLNAKLKPFKEKLLPFPQLFPDNIWPELCKEYPTNRNNYQIKHVSRDPKK